MVGCPVGLEQQQRRPLPAAETGRSCWGSVLIFQSPVRGLRKNQQTQPVRRRTSGSVSNQPSGLLLSPRVPIFRNVYRGDYCPVGEYDFKCPPLCSGHLQRNNYFNFAFGATAFAERSVAMKAPVGLLSGRAVCVSRWRGFAPTSSAERSKRIFTGRGVTANRQLTRSATVSERNKRCKCHFPLRPLCENATPGRPQSARRCSIL